MNIREAQTEDFESIWPILHEIVQAGETYTYDRDIKKEQTFQIWMKVPKKLMSLKNTETS